MKQLKSLFITAILLLPSMSYGMMQRLSKRAIATGAAVGAIAWNWDSVHMRRKTIDEQYATRHISPHVAQNHRPASLWQTLVKREPSRKERVDSFVRDCSAMKQENSRIPDHTKNDNTVRIATYNVHAWHNPYGFHPDEYNAKHIKNVIKKMNADVLVLQEAGYNDKKFFAPLGYVHSLRSACGQNLIVSKYPIKICNNGIFQSDARRSMMNRRSLMHVEVALPNNNRISLYGTHLDVYDNTEKTRVDEVREIVQKSADDQCKNQLVMADFNAVRALDYRYRIEGQLVWDVLNRSEKSRTGLSVQTDALALLEKEGFRDCFSRAQIKPPRFSVWSGTLIDFIFLNQQWQLPIRGCYMRYTAASDHCPIIMDVNVEKNFDAQQNRLCT